jgi:hypothetical protein
VLKKKNHGKVTTHNYQALDQGTKKLTASLFFLAAHEHTKKKKKINFCFGMAKIYEFKNLKFKRNSRGSHSTPATKSLREKDHREKIK